MDRLLQDLKHAGRAILRNPGFTALTVLTLAIGIGINVAGFGVIHSILLAPLPYPDADRLVTVFTEIPEQGVQAVRSTPATIEDWRTEGRVFQDLAMFDGTSMTLTGGEWAERISTARISWNLFSIVGIGPSVGREFLREEEEGRIPVAILGEDFARSRFGDPSAALGRTVELGGTPLEVVGVMPADFGYPERNVQIWFPWTLFNAPAAGLPRGPGEWSTIARLAPGVSPEQAQEEMSLLARRLGEEYPSTNAGLGVRVVPLYEQVTGQSYRLVLWTLFGAVGLLLLIACANGAHLILANGLGRVQEFAVRSALGATTLRLVRQTVAENVLIAILAGAVGLQLGAMALRVFVRLAPGSIPRLHEVGISGATVAYTAGLALLAGVAFGLAPAIGYSRARFIHALREGRNPGPRSSGQRARRTLIVIQFAMAIILVYGANLLIRSLMEARSVDIGFASENVMMANLSVEPVSARQSFYARVVEEVGELPGIEAAAIVEEIFISGVPVRPVRIEGQTGAEPRMEQLRIDAIAGDFFGAVGVPIREGRAFGPVDGVGTLPVAIINETMANRFWPGESPIGKRFATGVGDGDGDGGAWVEVVGVVADMRRQGAETAPIPQAFRPYAQAPSRNMILLARAAELSPGLTTALRDRIAGIDRTVPLYGATTLHDSLGRYYAERRFQTTLLSLFSGIALVLAAIGIYGLVQYSVSQRKREIGVRIALGASAESLVSMVLRYGLSMALPGLAIGLAGAALLGRGLSSLLFGISAFDPGVILLTAGVLLGTTVIACLLPARRAARIDAMEALRSA